ncbi:MAG: AAA family ATPase [Candidatus Rokubacteria bacterium]|nr:AAA family ATPase [Candidatus Rokubacteria bacterium]
MVALSISLLGGFEARLDSGGPLSMPSRKAQALLAYLASRPGRVHPRDKLAALLWGDCGEARARDSLRHTLTTLRKAFRAIPPVLLADGPTVALAPAAVEVDAVVFERLVAEGTPASLETAAALYRGDLLAGLAVSEPLYEEWLVAERERLHELALEGLARLLAHQSRTEQTERAIQTAVRLLTLDPLQEAVHRALMRLYARQGRRGAALRQYQVCLGVLQRELGAEPEAETKQVYREILQRRPPEAATLEAPPRPEPREPRLRPAVRHPELPTAETPLIGRDPALGRLRQALDEAADGRGRVAIVLGEAGIGKSRLVAEVAALALDRDARVLFGRCYESARILPFSSWIDAIRAGLAIAGTDALDTLGHVWRAELVRLLPELGEPRGADAPASEDRLRLFEALAQLVTRFASAGPLLLVLEDLHWADEMSLRFLSFLAHRVGGGPILVVATAREEEVADTLSRTLAELRREPAALELTLGPLSREATAKLVRALGRTGRDALAPAQLEEQVWRAS